MRVIGTEAKSRVSQLKTAALRVVRIADNEELAAIGDDGKSNEREPSLGSRSFVASVAVMSPI